MRTVLACIMIANLLSASPGMAQNPVLKQDSILLVQRGMASYYGKDFHRKNTASGEVFDMNAFTAAHKNLPFGTRIRVRRVDNGFQVIVEVNDRLPQDSERIIDLSRRAAEQLDMIRDGLAEVELFALSTAAIEQLRLHYGEVPPGMRLRLYHFPVEWAEIPTPDLSWVLNHLKDYLKLVNIYFL